ncbi:metal ABC transporter permease [Aliamphritea ceti]|uniref:metal ABC transporter permease n=1 Tax=Aliamphritea ceti TaxID=1524258 RepID=UPI0021C3A2F7|nr:metal ABC transporter permease [Aliamphritea ceti]
MTHELWIFLIASLMATSCALVGSLMVLRRMAMIGDALSHTVLLGLVLAFMLTGERSLTVMFVGATVVGLVTVFLTDLLNRMGKLQKDACIGIVFTFLFALAIILISAYTGEIDIDQEHLLYGEIAFAPFDTFEWQGQDVGPRAFWSLLFVTVANLLFIVIGYRHLQTVAFNASLATALGMSVNLIHYALTTMVSLTTVASFEAVGAILVVAMLVIPANTAYLFCRSIQGMLIWSVIFAIAASISGYYLAVWADASISAAIAMMSGFIFILILITVGPESVIQKIKFRFGLNRMNLS